MLIKIQHTYYCSMLEIRQNCATPEQLHQIDKKYSLICKSIIFNVFKYYLLFVHWILFILQKCKRESEKSEKFKINCLTRLNFQWGQMLCKLESRIEWKLYTSKYLFMNLFLIYTTLVFMKISICLYTLTKTTNIFYS